ncbi:hypothetical protein EDB80DRAFT_806532 [Ilyonectria destructans]|nr:hypothetical protein EDB80DRAFT_806532 [Ilyonectria destructans]
MATSTPGPGEGPAPSVSTPVTATPAATSATIEFDPAGDLYLIVGSLSQEMLVDSRVLCRSSAVFRKMLSKNFLEAKPNEGKWRVSLPKDSSHTFALLMDIVHGVYDRATNKIAASQLYRLCILTNKYDMTQALRPMASRWLAPYSSPQMLLDPKGFSITNMMFIAWEMGHCVIFEALAKTVAWRYHSSLDNELLYPNGTRLQDTCHFNSTGILEHITKYRQDILAVVRKSCYDTIQELLARERTATFCSRNKCHPRAAKIDDATVLGDILQLSQELGIIEFFNHKEGSPEFNGSLTDLKYKLGVIQNSNVSCSCGGPVALILASMTRESDAKHPLVVTDWHKKHLSIQAAKTKVLVGA